MVSHVEFYSNLSNPFGFCLKITTYNVLNNMMRYGNIESGSLNGTTGRFSMQSYTSRFGMNAAYSVSNGADGGVPMAPREFSIAGY